MNHLMIIFSIVNKKLYKKQIIEFHKIIYY